MLACVEKAVVADEESAIAAAASAEATVLPMIMMVLRRATMDDALPALGEPMGEIMSRQQNQSCYLRRRSLKRFGGDGSRELNFHGAGVCGGGEGGLTTLRQNPEVS